MRFSDLGVSPFFEEKLARAGITRPTEVQKIAIPHILNGENLLFRSATGTGKTFAYMLPLFERLFAPTGGTPEASAGKLPPRLLILAPTLELCSQIKREADFLLEGARVKSLLLIGSANMTRQIDALKKEKPDVIVGNTARILQIARMGKLKLFRLDALVLDEADRLCADDSHAELEELVAMTKPARQLVACSATAPQKARNSLRELFGETAFLETEEQEILRERITHWAFFSEDRKKIGTLRSFLQASRASKALVFTNGGDRALYIAASLRQDKISAEALAGGMEKKARRLAVENFRKGDARVLVSSDLAARGLDIPDISHVIQLDVPLDPDGYIHRAGRTARAGKKGFMITIGDEEEMLRFSRLEKKLGIIVYPKVLYGGAIHTAS